MLVPRSLIWQICFTGGYRLPKRTLLTKEQCSGKIETPVKTAIIPFHTSTYSHPRLTETQYRYFSCLSEKVNTGTAYCRYCDAIVYLPKGLELHKLHTNCRHNIDFLISVISQDRICIMCEECSKIKRWGVPFCGTACEEDFRNRVSLAWRKERSIVRNMKPGVKVGHVTL